MVVAKISDGLGNQMFQYAFGRSVAEHREETLKLDTSSFTKRYKLRSFLLESFSIKHAPLSLMEKIRYDTLSKYIRKVSKKFPGIARLLLGICCEKKEYEFDETVFGASCHYFDGYWQDARYFENIRKELLEELSLIEPLNQDNIQMLETIQKCEAVSVHIRRGDYLKIKHQQVCTLEYYRKAVDILLGEVENPTFFIFSDDIEWARENLALPNETFFVDFNQDNPERDLELIKNCKHNVIANSTFSWWGAWLNRHDEKIVIVPTEWRVGFPIPKGLVLPGWREV